MAYGFFLPILDHGFLISDDAPNIYRNFAITNQEYADFLIWSVTDTTTSLRYKPVTWWVFRAIWDVFGSNPGAYHAVSLVLHLANTILLFYIIITVFALELKKLGKLKWTIPAVFTLFWAIHPLRVEPIAWAAQMSYPLATFLILLAFVFYRRWRQDPRLNWPLFLGFVFYLLALGTYPIVLTCGLVLVVDEFIDWLKFRAAEPSCFPPDGKKRFTVVALAAAPALGILLFTVSGIENYQDKFWDSAPVSGLDPILQIEMAVHNMFRYVWLEIWPFPAEIFQAFMWKHQPLPLWCLLLLITEGGVLFLMLRNQHAVRSRSLLRIHLYLVAVSLPSVGLMIPDYLPAMKNHYLSGMLIAVFLAGALLAVDSKRVRWGLVMFTIVVIALFSFKSREILADHKNSDTYFKNLEKFVTKTSQVDMRLVNTLRARGAFEIGDHAGVLEYFRRVDSPERLHDIFLVEYAISSYLSREYAECIEIMQILVNRTGMEFHQRVLEGLHSAPGSPAVDSLFFSMNAALFTDRE